MDIDNSFLGSADIILISTGIFTGTISRLITLKVDYRQIPSHPNGYFINLVAGVIASALGAVAIPALFAKDFAAFTFLALAIEQFRETRKIEAESLQKLESTEFTNRGEAYIDGIAKTYEARNYISLITSIATVLAMTLIHTGFIIVDILIGVITGLVVLFIIFNLTQGKSIGDICNVKPGIITVIGSELFVDGIYVTNLLGTDQSREMFLKEGIAVVIEPKSSSFRITLDNYGQRQAILFEALRAFGVKRYSFTRRSYSTGKIVVAFVPIISDIDKLLEVVRNTPILESSRKLRRLIKNPLIGGN